MSEIWKRHPVWACEVSNRGQVRRLSDGAILAQSPGSRGYLRVTVPEGKLKYTHVLVLEAISWAPPTWVPIPSFEWKSTG